MDKLDMTPLADAMRRKGMGHIFDAVAAMTPREREQFKVDSYNRSKGPLCTGWREGDKEHPGDGYDCPKCLNRGNFLRVEDIDGDFRQYAEDCECLQVRANLRRFRASGLGNIIEECTFDKYEASATWQQIIKGAAMEYSQKLDGWFFLGGQPGCGKTHLCTAICREHLLAGRHVRYMLWVDEAQKIKGVANESDEYEALIAPLKSADILYIDDFFKAGFKFDDKTGKKKRVQPTAADIRLAYEILNSRVVGQKPTIISTEYSLEGIIDIDEALGSRINQMCKRGTYNYSIDADRSKNYRLRNATTL